MKKQKLSRAIRKFNKHKGVKAVKSFRLMNIPVQAVYVVALMVLNVVMLPRTIYYIVRYRNKPMTPAEENRITQKFVEQITKELEKNYHGKDESRERPD